MVDLDTFGAALRSLRLRGKAKTLAEVAEIAGVDPANLSRYETDQA